MTPPPGDRRKFSEDDKAEIGDIIRHELVDRWSFVKNGHTWAQWFGKIVTVERVFMVIVLGYSLSYSFGGGVREVLYDLKEAAKTAKVASDKADFASTKAEAAAAKAEVAATTNTDIQRQIGVIQQQIEERARQQEAFRIEMRMKLSKLEVMPTKRELREAIDVGVEKVK